MTTKSRPAPNATKFFAAAFGVVFALMTLWSLATPLMGVPDEPSHAIRAAAVVRGEIIGQGSADGKHEAVVKVPAYINFTMQMGCFATKPTVTPACAKDFTGDPNTLVGSSSSASSNSPVFYFVAGAPSLFLSGDVALYGMRIASALLSSLLAAGFLTVISGLARGIWPTVVGAASITPMILFLGGSLNPNAVEATSAALLFVSLIAFFSRPLKGATLWWHIAAIIGATVFLTGTRSISLLWVVLIVAAAAFSLTKGAVRRLVRQRTTWIGLGVAAIASLLALRWFTTPLPTVTVFQPHVNSQPLAAALSQMVDKTFDYWNDWVGYFGWLDQPAPTVAYVLWFALILSTLIAAIVIGRGPLRWATVFLFACALVVPLFVQASLYDAFGMLWQGRYMLAIYTTMLLAAGLALDAAYPETSPRAIRLARAGAVLLAAAHLATFIYVLRRYVVGSSSWIAMLVHDKWQPPGGWILLSLLFGLVLALGVWLLWRQLGALSVSHARADETTLDSAPRTS